jgi:hypothetical protein
MTSETERWAAGILDGAEKATLVVNPVTKAEVCVGAKVVAA